MEIREYRSMEQGRQENKPQKTNKLQWAISKFSTLRHSTTNLHALYVANNQR